MFWVFSLSLYKEHIEQILQQNSDFHTHFNLLSAPDFEHPAPKQTGVAKIFLICTRTQNFGAKKNNYLQNYNIWEAPFYIVR